MNKTPVAIHQKRGSLLTLQYVPDYFQDSFFSCIHHDFVHQIHDWQKRASILTTRGRSEPHKILRDIAQRSACEYQLETYTPANLSRNTLSISSGAVRGRACTQYLLTHETDRDDEYPPKLLSLEANRRHGDSRSKAHLPDPGLP